ncbi:MAG: hypothetical protein O3B64_00475 [bacterium]|nr:hypothetical protein [bacterium]
MQTGLITYVVREVIVGAVYAPIWWYTRGLLEAFKTLAKWFRAYARSLAIGVWMKNLFVPMYGQRDWQSRIISVFFRTIVICGKSIVLLIWACTLGGLFVLYLTLPIAALYMITYHFYG